MVVLVGNVARGRPESIGVGDYLDKDGLLVEFYVKESDLVGQLLHSIRIGQYVECCLRGHVRQLRVAAINDIHCGRLGETVVRVEIAYLIIRLVWTQKDLVEAVGFRVLRVENLLGECQ